MYIFLVLFIIFVFKESIDEAAKMCVRQNERTYGPAHTHHTYVRFFFFFFFFVRLVNNQQEVADDVLLLTPFCSLFLYVHTRR